MPEGDTIYRAAAVLRRALVGRQLLRLESPRIRTISARAVEGSSITHVESHGKHLIIGFEGGRALRTHLRMTGSWHLYHPGERWRKPAHRATVTLETENAVAVCFSAPEVEILKGRAAEPGGATTLTGPDLLDPGFDADQVAARWALRPELPIGVALMRQHLAAGIGNVYKSEVLFMCRVDPFRKVGDLDRDTLALLAETAHRALSDNVDGGRRRTRRPGAGARAATARDAPSRLWVYGRSGRPCFECGAEVRMRRQGDDGRSTYFCPVCQGETEPGRSPLS